MLHPVFDIASEELASAQWMRCRLLLELNRHFLQYVISEEKSLLCWKYYELPAASPAEKMGMVESILQSDALLHNSVKEQTIVYNFPKNCLLPGALYDPGQGRPLLEIMQGDLQKGPVITEKVPGWNLYNVFRLPGGLDELCKNHFPHAAFHHHASLWLAYLNKQQEGVHLLFSAYDMAICVFHRQKLQLVQSYPYHDHDELLYHLFNLFVRLRLNREQTPVYAAGMVQTDSPVYKELAKYFQRLKPTPLPEKFRVPGAFQAVPEHFFSPLIKMSQCV